jgi:hypothetical protein
VVAVFDFLVFVLRFGDASGFGENCIGVLVRALICIKFCREDWYMEASTGFGHEELIVHNFQIN